MIQVVENLIFAKYSYSYKIIHYFQDSFNWLHWFYLVLVKSFNNISDLFM